MKNIDWNYFDYNESDDGTIYAEKYFTDLNDWEKNKRYLDFFLYARICDEDGDIKEEYEDIEARDPDETEKLFQHLEIGDYVEVCWEF